MRHPSLSHLPRRQRWLHLQQFNGGWVGGFGLLLFMAVALCSLMAAAMVMVTTGVTRELQDRGLSELGFVTGAAIAVAVAACVWEGFRRVLINRLLDNAGQRCRGCGYDLSRLNGRCPECGLEP
jgi:lipopolysaccharide biosynthesis regulator YciM